MIVLTRLNGSPFAINPDIVQRVEATPDTVVTLVDGTRFIVGDPVAAVVDAVRSWRASVIAAASDPDALQVAACPECQAERVSALAADASATDGRSATSGAARTDEADRNERAGRGPVVPMRRRRP